MSGSWSIRKPCGGAWELVALAWALGALGFALGAPAAAPAQAQGDRPQPPRSAQVESPRASAAGPSDVLEEPSALPSGGSKVFPDHRVVCFWGAPQLTRSILGRLSPAAAGRRLEAQAEPYERPGRPVVRSLELVATIATADRGRDGRYRARQSDRVIGTYLSAARRAGARLILDVQPGRSTFIAEVAALRDWLREPDVDVAIDPEWNVGPRGVPGRTQGVARAAAINRVSRYLADLVLEEGLPQKLLVVHQFRAATIPDRASLRAFPGLALTLNFDGIGTPRAKAVGYRRLSSRPFYDGFSLFYRLDRDLMSPSEVLRLRPVPDYVLYQ